MRKTRVVMFLLILSILFIPTVAFAADNKLHFISAEKGDSIIIQSNGHCGLVDALNPEEYTNPDTGEVEVFEDNAQKIVNYAIGAGCSYFDFVIMTHSHYDHIGGIPELGSFFNDKTLVFFKEDIVSKDANDVIDDYEDGGDLHWNNHWFLTEALSTFENSNSITCDLREAHSLNDPKCDLSTLSNDFIESVSYDANEDFDFDSNVKENVYFDFGDYRITMYNLNILSYHVENLNSIVTLVTQKNSSKTALLTGDIETARGDLDELRGVTSFVNKTTLIENPTGTCYECVSLGIENQIARVIDTHIDVLKAAHHGGSSSNSLYALNMYYPNVYITQGGTFYTQDNIAYPKSDNTAAIAYAKHRFGTKAYNASQVTGAIVVNLDDGSVEAYDENGFPESTDVSELSYFYPDGWKYMNVDTNLYNEEHTDRAFVYIENGSLYTGWKYSDNKWYVLDGYSGLMATGIYDDTDGNRYYLSDDYATYGQMETGWKILNSGIFYFRTSENDILPGKEGAALTDFATIDSYTYYFRPTDNNPNNGTKCSAVTGLMDYNGETFYFRTEQNSPTDGPIASMVTGFVYIDGAPHYFRTSEDEVSTGSLGSMLKDACVTYGDGYYCFDENGTLSSQIITIDEPTTDKCLSNITYDGTEKTLVSLEDTGYTWSNHKQTNAGDYSVVATLAENYKWRDGTTEPKNITCSIAKKQEPVPVMTIFEFDYSGNEIRPIIDNYNDYIMNKEGTDIATDAADQYEVTISLKYPENYEWVGGTNEAISLVWKINKVSYNVPTVEPFFGKYDGNVHGVTATGDGELQYSTDGINWQDDNFEFTNAGEYEVRVRVKADNNHYASAEVISTVTINKNVFDFPTLEESLFNYTGDEITPVLSGVDYDNMTVSGDLTGTNAGTYSIAISLNDRNNTMWTNEEDGTKIINWTIAKISGDKPTAMGYTGIYDKQPHSIQAIGSGELEYSLDDITFTSEKPTLIDADTLEVFVRVKGDDNHEPSESVSAFVTISKRTLIKPTRTTSNYLFTGEPVNFSINFYNDNWTEWMEKTGTYTATDVGSYVATVGLIDTNNTEWNDHTIEDVSFNWSIVQSQSTNPVITNYVGAYDGEPHSITVEPVSYGTILYSTNYNIPGEDPVWVNVNPTRTNVGTTNVYVQIIGDSNHTNSQIVMGSITITDAIPDYQISNYNIDEANSMILGITVGTTVENFTSNITLGDGYRVEVDSKTVNGKQVLYTGGKVRILQGNVVVAEFTNVVVGDVNGNGTIDIIDYIRIMKDIMDTEKLTGAFGKAADVNGNNSIDIIDYIRIMKIIMEEE
ncbi:MAG: hypothetical protein IKZ96_00535 [Bacilli bacterium]|nr:hypothetical protein [Bacilli bacterium]